MNLIKRLFQRKNRMKLYELHGKGNLTVEDLVVESSFKIESYIQEQALLYFELPMFSKDRYKIYAKDKQDFKFEGILPDGTKIDIKRLLLISHGDIIKGKQQPLKFKIFSDISLSRGSMNKSDDEKIIFKITNLDFTGSEKTITPFGGWKLDHFTLSIKGYHIEVRQIDDFKEIVTALKKKQISSAQTTIITVTGKHEKQDEIRTIVNDICWLMSFAKGNSIVPFGELHVKGEKTVQEIYRSVRVENFVSGDHVIDDLPIDNLPKFIEQAYSNYILYKKELGLDVIFNYYELMKRNPIMDVRCVLGYILLECLSNNTQEYYTSKGTPIQNSLKKSKSAKLKKILDKEKVNAKIIEQIASEFIYSQASLQDSINEIMKEFKMGYKKGEDELFKLRKEFIHKGRFPPNINPIQTYNKLVHFIDRIILHILNYKGEYLDITQRYIPVKLEYKK
jgi:hypothetical protein